MRWRQTLKNSGRLDIAERLAESGQQTFGSTDKVDPLGAGIGLGYNFAPLSSGVRFGLFGSFDWLDQTINHFFPGGTTFIGTRSHWIATAGVKAGITTGPGIFVYGLTGASLLNQDLNINFGGPVTSSNKTVPGGTLGLGGEFAPVFLQGFGRPVSVFVQYQHTWWQDAHLDRPVASPLFNYAFRRQDDTIRVGLNIYLGTPVAATEPGRQMYVKARPK